MAMVGATVRWGRVGRSAAGVLVLALAGCDAILGIPGDLHPGSSGESTTGGSTTTSGSGGNVVESGPTLAIHKLLIGDATVLGQPSDTAWKAYGFNLDDKVSTAQSTDLCKPAADAAPADAYPDGNGGIDNNFGKVVVPIYKFVIPEAPTQLNDAIDQGLFTVLLQIGGLGPGKTGTFASGAYVGAMAPGTLPDWTGMDAWQIRSDCLIGRDLSTPVALYPMSEVTLTAGGQRIYSSVDAGTITLSVEVGTFHLLVPIRKARISMVLSNDNIKATDGRIGGVINTEAFVEDVRKTATAIDKNFCTGGALDGVLKQIRQASDILSDGTQDPDKTCDAISIGLGFEAEAAFLGEVFDPSGTPDPCK